MTIQKTAQTVDALKAYLRALISSDADHPLQTVGALINHCWHESKPVWLRWPGGVPEDGSGKQRYIGNTGGGPVALLREPIHVQAGYTEGWFYVRGKCTGTGTKDIILSDESAGTLVTVNLTGTTATHKASVTLTTTGTLLYTVSAENSTAQNIELDGVFFVPKDI